MGWRANICAPQLWLSLKNHIQPWCIAPFQIQYQIQQFWITLSLSVWTVTVSVCNVDRVFFPSMVWKDFFLVAENITLWPTAISKGKHGEMLMHDRKCWTRIFFQIHLLKNLCLPFPHLRFLAPRLIRGSQFLGEKLSEWIPQILLNPTNYPLNYQNKNINLGGQPTPLVNTQRVEDKQNPTLFQLSHSSCSFCLFLRIPLKSSSFLPYFWILLFYESS